MNKNGFTLIEVMIVLVIISILAVILAQRLLNNRGATEKRALAAAEKFAQTNRIDIERISCAGDSDNDGYGSCVIVTSKGEKIMLNCPCSYMDTKFWGAEECKEVLFNIGFQQSAIATER